MFADQIFASRWQSNRGGFGQLLLPHKPEGQQKVGVRRAEPVQDSRVVINERQELEQGHEREFNCMPLVLPKTGL